jgi:hypothetical protein
LLGIGKGLAEGGAARALDEIDEVAPKAGLVVIPPAGLLALDHYSERTLAPEA